MKANIKQVAKRAGVSIGAVSRFLGGTLSLPDDTAARIRNAVDDLNYSPHASARRLRSGRSETVGFVAPEISNPFFGLLASAIGASAWDQGMDLTVWSSDDVMEREVASVKRLRSSFIDGLIVITNHKSDAVLIEEMIGAGPIVIVDEDIASVEASRVFVDNEHGAWLATRTLLDMGHTRIAHVGPPSHLMTSELRSRGWRRALTEAAVPVPENYYQSGLLNEQTGRDALLALLELPSPPTAIFVGSDPIAFGIIAASHEIGLKIPRELSIISFDGLPIGKLLDPPLSTVAQPIRQMGAKSVELLMRRIKDPGAPMEKAILPVSLEMRSSAIAI